MPWWIWVGFVAFIAALVFFDLVVLHRRSHAISLKEALGWTAVWVSVALTFNALVYLLYDGRLWSGWVPHMPLSGKGAAMQFLTGYVIEYSLSVDNIFVIAMIIANFHVPTEYQHRLLFWGVLGAALLRGIMIGVGTALIHRFEWVMLVFGALLIISAAKMLVTRHDNIDPERNLFVRLTRKVFPVTTAFHGQQFFAQIGGVRHATPMFLALVLIESCDVMFAVDSIPAVFAVTRDPFLVFTSNIFAVLGLRSLYFALAGLMDKFSYLKTSLVFLLVFVGMKMILSHFYGHEVIPNGYSLAMIAGILGVGIITSIVAARKDTAPLHSPLDPEIATGLDAAEAEPMSVDAERP